MFRSRRFRQRLVINIDTAERIGVVSDMEIDELTGRITQIIVRRGSFIPGFLRMNEIMIPWDSIKASSNEFILVKIFDLPA